MKWRPFLARMVPLLVAAFMALTASAQPPFTELETVIRGLEALLREQRRRAI
ncbi:MAG: hypothetical protein HYY78_10065 [Betaproteobacteria bacterium]|nr:hypothetical protein [Betaproteobacteria bacterium]